MGQDKSENYEDNKCALFSLEYSLLQTPLCTRLFSELLEKKRTINNNILGPLMMSDNIASLKSTLNMNFRGIETAREKRRL